MPSGTTGLGASQNILFDPATIEINNGLDLIRKKDLTFIHEYLSQFDEGKLSQVTHLLIYTAVNLTKKGKEDIESPDDFKSELEIEIEENTSILEKINESLSQFFETVQQGNNSSKYYSYTYICLGEEIPEYTERLQDLKNLHTQNPHHQTLKQYVEELEKTEGLADILSIEIRNKTEFDAEKEKWKLRKTERNTDSSTPVIEEIENELFEELYGDIIIEPYDGDSDSDDEDNPALKKAQHQNQDHV